MYLQGNQILAEENLEIKTRVLQKVKALAENHCYQSPRKTLKKY